MSPDKPANDVLVVVPALNEEQTLPIVISSLRDRGDVDVLVVNDGSTDATEQVAKDCGADVITLPFNLGVGGAMRAGFKYATQKGYSCVVQFDGDGQHRAEEIPALLSGISDGADLVIGSRFADGASNFQVSAVRGGAMRLLRVSVKVLVGQRFTDTSSGFRAFSRPLIEFFSRTYPAEYLGDSVEALLLASYSGFKVVEKPVGMNPRVGGTPSQKRWRLAYHYLRLIIIMLIGARPRRVEDQG